MSAILALRPHPPVETVGLGNRAGEFELGERSRHCRGVEAGLTDEGIDPARLADEDVEHACRRLAELPAKSWVRRRFPTPIEHVAGRRERRRAKAQQRVRPRRQRGRDLAGHGEDLPPGLECEVGGDQGAAALARLDDDVAAARPAMIRLRAGNRQGAGSTPGAYSETTSPLLADPGGELGVCGRVVAVDATTEHGHRWAVGLERATVGLAVDAAREAADDDEPRRR